MAKPQPMLKVRNISSSVIVKPSSAAVSWIKLEDGLGLEIVNSKPMPARSG